MWLSLEMICTMDVVVSCLLIVFMYCLTVGVLEWMVPSLWRGPFTFSWPHGDAGKVGKFSARSSQRSQRNSARLGSSVLNTSEWFTAKILVYVICICVGRNSMANQCHPSSVFEAFRTPATPWSSRTTATQINNTCIVAKVLFFLVRKIWLDKA